MESLPQWVAQAGRIVEAVGLHGRPDAQTWHDRWLMPGYEHKRYWKDLDVARGVVEALNFAAR
jgi:hypothetical protein